MDYKDKLDQLLEKIIQDYTSVIKLYEKGYGNVDYHKVFEEMMFLKLISLDDCIDDDRFYSKIEYFLSNDYTINRLW